MAKKSLKKATKPLGPESATARSGKSYPVEPEELDAQQERIKKIAAAGAEPLKSLAPPSTSPARLLPARVPPQPLAPLADLWPSEPTRAPGQATAVAHVPSPPAPPGIKVTFVLPESTAQRVSLCSEFNGWSPDATPMKRQADGHWETTVALARGRYQYKFIVDGRWIPDPLARENVPNPHGTLNSVIEVRA